MTEFKFITKGIEEQGKKMWEIGDNDTPNVEYMQYVALLEIAYQLRRIADKLK